MSDMRCNGNELNGKKRGKGKRIMDIPHDSEYNTMEDNGTNMEEYSSPPYKGILVILPTDVVCANNRECTVRHVILLSHRDSLRLQCVHAAEIIFWDYSSSLSFCVVVKHLIYC